MVATNLEPQQNQIELPSIPTEFFGLQVEVHQGQLIEMPGFYFPHALVDRPTGIERSIRIFAKQGHLTAVRKYIKEHSPFHLELSPHYKLNAQYVSTTGGNGALPANSIIGIKSSDAIEPTGAIHLLHPLTRRPEILKEVWGPKVHEFLNQHSEHLKPLIEPGKNIRESLNLSFKNLFQLLEGMDFTKREEDLNRAFTFYKNSKSILGENEPFMNEIYNTIFTKILYETGQHQWSRELFNSVDWQSVHHTVLSMGVGPNGSLGHLDEEGFKYFTLTLDRDSDMYKLALTAEKQAEVKRRMQLKNQLSEEMQEFTEALTGMYGIGGWILDGLNVSSQKYCPLFPASNISEGQKHAFILITQFAIDILDAQIK